MKRIRPSTGYLWTAMIVLLLSGCASRDISDLQQWTEEMKSRPGGRIDPLPEIKPYEAYTYKGVEEEKRNPFQPFYRVRETESEDVGDNLTAEMEREIKNRNREELEQFELDSLRMVGVLEDTDEEWGIIQDPDGVVHRVKVGNYLGRNIGKIINIMEDRIVLREIIKDNQGRWEERQAEIALIQEES